MGCAGASQGWREGKGRRVEKEGGAYEVPKLPREYRDTDSGSAAAFSSLVPLPYITMAGI